MWTSGATRPVGEFSLSFRSQCTPTLKRDYPPPNPSRLSMKRVIAVLGLLLFVAIAALVALFYRPHTNLLERTRVNLERILPSGSTTDRAIAVLDSLRVVHSSLVMPDRIITANFGESYRLFLVSSSVYVTLYFDASDRLQQTKVEEIGSGP